MDLNSAGYAPGAYSATLCINSDDPVTPLISVPVTMTVESEVTTYYLYLPVVARP